MLVGAGAAMGAGAGRGTAATGDGVPGARGICVQPTIAPMLKAATAIALTVITTVCNTPSGASHYTIIHHRQAHRMIRTPPNTSSGAAGLRNRLSTPGPFVTPPAGIPGAPIPAGSLRMPAVA